LAGHVGINQALWDGPSCSGANGARKQIRVQHLPIRTLELMQYAVAISCDALHYGKCRPASGGAQMTI
jgi:hypothetical protein